MTKYEVLIKCDPHEDLRLRQNLKKAVKMTLGSCVCVSHTTCYPDSLNRVMLNSWAMSIPYYCLSPYYSIYFILSHNFLPFIRVSVLKVVHI